MFLRIHSLIKTFHSIEKLEKSENKINLIRIHLDLLFLFHGGLCQGWWDAEKGLVDGFGGEPGYYQQACLR